VIINLRIRIWTEGQPFSDEQISASFELMDKLLPELAKNHAEQLLGIPHTIEIEFLDEPDPRQRFFRFGTDPRRMARPERL